MRVHQLTFAAALAVAASLSLTACQNDDTALGQGDPSATGSSTGGGSGSGGPDQGGEKDTAGSTSGGKGTTATAGTGSSGSGKAGKCRTDDLLITAMERTIDGDEEATVAVEFENHSDRGCVISGFAGVDLKTDAGPLSATRTNEKPGSSILESGKSIAFGITYPFNSSGGSGVRVTGLVVTPPGETKSVTLDWPGAATLPVTEGSGSSVKVGPMGSAGQGG
ncbi:hypothetical protein EES43_16770 [Streptomyces sp. ADI96-02]|uniref:DUF4232 domain-containing protein n=1 Tax=Streptomyces sp. ADI96-02 TaxID=1522760 RepID=UPI000F558AB9|nr:DUF4232 domain-containing protein [Streptomyces sp. ADI96-02]RPK60773.1 hypothetical protein EES43_16770 [Streptomyces sp. ADI96-02]